MNNLLVRKRGKLLLTPLGIVGTCMQAVTESVDSRHRNERSAAAGSHLVRPKRCSVRVATEPHSQHAGQEKDGTIT